MRFLHVVQDGLELLSSSYLLASASQSVGIIGVSHYAGLCVWGLCEGQELFLIVKAQSIKEQLWLKEWRSSSLRSLILCVNWHQFEALVEPERGTSWLSRFLSVKGDCFVPISLCWRWCHHPPRASLMDSTPCVGPWSRMPIPHWHLGADGVCFCSSPPRGAWNQKEAGEDMCLGGPVCEEEAAGQKGAGVAKPSAPDSLSRGKHLHFFSLEDSQLPAPGVSLSIFICEMGLMVLHCLPLSLGALNCLAQVGLGCTQRPGCTGYTLIHLYWLSSKCGGLKSFPPDVSWEAEMAELVSWLTCFTKLKRMEPATSAGEGEESFAKVLGFGVEVKL
ncbi:hypothetical protein AAY473_012583 [Plecturocebus cupreus]